jgi:ribonuclease D
MALITQTNELEAFCARLAGVEFIAVDTEFMRERTYWPTLCLVQVAGPEEAAAIDALAPGINLDPLYRLLAARETVKVFHAARQDLEIFHQRMGDLPVPVFDTQVAAMVCGFGEQVSYETLVSKLARAKIDKGSRFSDWSLRPLSARQVDYALADVVHLRPVYRKLQARLASSQRSEWLAEEMATLCDPRTYVADPAAMFRRMKTRSANPRVLAVLREVAAWRECEAQARDIPRNWVLRDEALLEIAHHMPSTVEELGRTRGLVRKTVEGPTGAAILAAVARGREIPDAECPLVDEKREPPRGFGAVVDLLKVLLKMKCDEADVAQKLVASAEDIEQLASAGSAANIPALHGWRRQVFGEDALKVRAGELALVVSGKKLTLIAADALDPQDEAKSAAMS